MVVLAMNSAGAPSKTMLPCTSERARDAFDRFFVLTLLGREDMGAAGEEVLPLPRGYGIVPRRPGTARREVGG